jgi:hypothetical protein
MVLIANNEHEGVEAYGKDAQEKQLLKIREIVYEDRWKFLTVPLLFTEWRSKFDICQTISRLDPEEKKNSLTLSIVGENSTDEHVNTVARYTVSINYDDLYFTFDENPPVELEILFGVLPSKVIVTKFGKTRYQVKLSVKKYIREIKVQNVEDLEADPVISDKYKQFDLTFVLISVGNRTVWIELKQEKQRSSFLTFIELLNREIEMYRLGISAVKGSQVIQGSRKLKKIKY